MLINEFKLMEILKVKPMIKKHLKSYQYAFRGVWLAFRYEQNMIIHFIAAIAVLTVNYLLRINKSDWIFTLILIGVVWMAEVFNTAIEKLADRVTKDHDPMIGNAKDLAAGAVLIIGFFAALCGVVIYWPYLTTL